MYEDMEKEITLKVLRARLDADRKAKPRIQIIAHHRPGVCIQAGLGAEYYEVRQNDE